MADSDLAKAAVPGSPEMQAVLESPAWTRASRTVRAGRAPGVPRPASSSQRRSTVEVEAPMSLLDQDGASCHRTRADE